jgi:hypothetical protein
MLLDANLMFWGSAPFASASNFTSLATNIPTAGITSSVIDLGIARDLGIGDGPPNPKLHCQIGTAITSSSAGVRLNFQFQGSTDSSNWTTYVETGALATSSFTASTVVFKIDVPHRSAGSAIPRYYRLNIAGTGSTVETISSGTILAGIVLQQDSSPFYPNNFSVV